MNKWAKLRNVCDMLVGHTQLLMIDKLILLIVLV